MKKLIYSGRYPNVTAGGAAFVRGEATEVSDELFAQLIKDPEFAAPVTEVPKVAPKKPGPVPVPAK